MKICCNIPVLQVTVGKSMVTVDAEPHPAGIYSIRHTTVDGWHYGEKLRGDQPPAAGQQRYRLHLHKKGD